MERRRPGETLPFLLGREGESSLRCLQTNTKNLGNEQEELEIHLQPQGYNAITLWDAGWGRTYDFGTIMEELPGTDKGRGEGKARAM